MKNQLPEQWTEGALVHIRKKDSMQECPNYRPICLTQIIYKIWLKLQTNRLSRILHFVTFNTQFGYKSGLSTIDAIIKLEQSIREGIENMAIILMDIAKAFGDVNRVLLWATLYKCGIPITAIQHIRGGLPKTILRHKENRTYGTPITNNVGVFQGSAISALLFIIYLDDVMQDYQAMNDNAQLPRRPTIQPSLQMHIQNITNHIRQTTRTRNTNETQQITYEAQNTRHNHKTYAKMT